MKLELINPATEKIFKELPYHDMDTVWTKLKSAKEIQKEWKQTSISYRISIIESSLKYFSDNCDRIARDITLQMGKPIKQSKNEVKSMIQRAKVCCRLAEDALKDIPLLEIEGFQRFIYREPLGVVLDIAAWNYPLLIAVNVVIPAVLAGNAVVIKHSSLTPLSALAFEDAFKHAGAPEGLITALIIDHAITEKIIQSDCIHHIAFTGSVDGGRQIQASSRNQFIDVGLELGGKDPAYIREDSDIEKVTPNIMDGVFYNAGQSCCAVERIYVHESLFHDFVEISIECMNKQKICNPMHNTSDMGPLAQNSGIKTIEKQLKEATDKDAKSIFYSGPIPESGKYLTPAILTNVNHGMEIMMKETFGPIVGIMAVKSDEEAIELMNDSPYGLTASVWTNDTKKAIEIGNQIETGTFFMNHCDFLDPVLPWVGVKDSGKGCTLSTLGIQKLTRPKGYNLKLNE